MPQIIKNFKRPKPRGRVSSKYPIASWFEKARKETDFQAGKGLKLVRGVDYTCSSESMENRLRKEATKAGIRVSMFPTVEHIVMFYVGQIRTPASRSANNHSGPKPCATAAKSATASTPPKGQPS
jgi:hypothetical protein